MSVNADKFLARRRCLEYLNLDLIGVAETHLRGSDVLEIPGFTWLGRNRSSEHVNAIRGSGGVGFLVRNSLLTFFRVDILDKEHEDILWIKLTSRTDSDTVFCICVCYLPPGNSSRQVCASDFFDKLLNGVYVYQLEGNIIVC